MPTRKTTTAPNDKYRQDALAAAQAALDKKGIEPVLLDLTQSGSYTDYLLITSGQADRTVRAIADGIVEVMKERGARLLGAEGLREGRWALLDFGDLVVHVFEHPLQMCIRDRSMLDNPNSDIAKPGKLIVDYDDQVCVPGPGITCSTEALNRGKGMKAACLNATDANFFGQAQIRMSSFIRKFDAASRVEQSICEPQNYATVLDVVADRITNRISANCLSGKPKTDSNGKPICIVGLVDANTPAAMPDVALPQCLSLIHI